MAELSPPVRGVLPATDTPLSGTGQIGYGVTVGSTGASEDWLVQGGTQGGIWTLTSPANTWARRADIDTSAEHANMPYVQVREGDSGVAGSVWYYSGVSAPTIGSSQLPWTMRTHGRPRFAGVGLDDNAFPNIQMVQQFAGTDDFIIPMMGSYIQATSRGVISDYSQSYGLDAFIAGLRLSWASALSATLGAGEASIYTQGVVTNPAAMTLNLSGATANTPYYIYIYMQAGSPVYTAFTPEVSTTQPGTPYLGTATGMTGNFFHRYVGMLRTGGTGQVYNFIVEQLGGSTLLVTYLEDTTAAPFRVVNGGAAITNQTVDVGPNGLKLVPPTARTIWARISVNGTAAVWIDNSSMSTSPAAGSGEVNVSTVARAAYAWISLDANQQFRWANTVSGGATNIDVLKYIDRR